MNVNLEVVLYPDNRGLHVPRAIFDEIDASFVLAF